ncbi:hypothetical protein ABZ917_20425 [Nonomuraea wenchangensis]
MPTASVAPSGENATLPYGTPRRARTVAPTVAAPAAAPPATDTSEGAKAPAGHVASSTGGDQRRVPHPATWASGAILSRALARIGSG